jgi:hypothetical protein
MGAASYLGLTRFGAEGDFMGMIWELQLFGVEIRLRVELRIRHGEGD